MDRGFELDRRRAMASGKDARGRPGAGTVSRFVVRRAPGTGGKVARYRTAYEFVWQRLTLQGAVRAAPVRAAKSGGFSHWPTRSWSRFSGLANFIAVEVLNVNDARALYRRRALL